MFRAHAVLGSQTITSLKASQDAPHLICLSKRSDVIRNWLYLGREKRNRKEGRTSIVGNYGNEAKKRGMIKIKGLRTGGNGSTRGHVLWQISRRIGSYRVIHQRARLVERFQWEFNWRYQKLWISPFPSIFFFPFVFLLNLNKTRRQIADEQIQRNI